MLRIRYRLVDLIITTECFIHLKYLNESNNNNNNDDNKMERENLFSIGKVETINEMDNK